MGASKVVFRHFLIFDFAYITAYSVNKHRKGFKSSYQINPPHLLKSQQVYKRAKNTFLVYNYFFLNII